MIRMIEFDSHPMRLCYEGETYYDIHGIVEDGSKTGLSLGMGR